ncbi:hypothetical protein GF360_00480 [candidate division WWE3 bacterium]|nr:hypothetical protein [candidate division WWE3 bacterium]
MKSIKLHINLIPLLIILFLIGGAGYFLFGQDLEIPIEDRKTKITRIEGFPRMMYVDEEREKIHRVLKSEEELNEFLNEVDPEGRLEFNEDVNFDRNYLIGTTTDTLEGENHEYKIRKIYKDTDDQTLTISRERVDPDEDCELDGGKNIWIDIVKINKTDWKIDFELVKKILPCDEEINETTEE